MTGLDEQFYKDIRIFMRRTEFSNSVRRCSEKSDVIMCSHENIIINDNKMVPFEVAMSITEDFTGVCSECGVSIWRKCNG